jgi:hypothetical protein
VVIGSDLHGWHPGCGRGATKGVGAPFDSVVSTRVDGSSRAGVLKVSGNWLGSQLRRHVPVLGSAAVEHPRAPVARYLLGTQAPFCLDARAAVVAIGRERLEVCTIDRLRK